MPATSIICALRIWAGARAHSLAAAATPLPGAAAAAPTIAQTRRGQSVSRRALTRASVCACASCANVSCGGGRRRRDVMVIFTLGAQPGEGGTAGLRDVLPSTRERSTPTADAPAAEATPPVEAPAEEPAGGKPSGRLAGLRARRARRKAKGGRSETSPPVIFKTDVAAKVERGRTAALKRKFSGRWTGKYNDLEYRVLHMTLVEQTRFGNLVEIGTGELSLLELATGSVQQEITFVERDGRAKIESYRLNFHIHFQVRAISTHLPSFCDFP